MSALPSTDAEPALEFIRAFNERDLDAFVAVLDPEVEIHSMRGLRRGVEEAREWATRPPGGVQQTIHVEGVAEDGEEIVVRVRREWAWEEDGTIASEEPMEWRFLLGDGRVRSWRPVPL